MNTRLLTTTTQRDSRRGWLRVGALVAALTFILTATLGLSAGRADAQAESQLGGGFPALSLSYADAQGPGSVTLTPQGPDAATGGTAIAATIAQSSGNYAGTGFVRQVDARSYILAATVTGDHGDSYFVSGTLMHGGNGQVWRGKGRWWAVGNPSVASDWYMAEWPVIQPAPLPRPQLVTTVQLGPAGRSQVSGQVHLMALPEGETRFTAELQGLVRGARYTVQLHAGTPGQPSASFTVVATVEGDAWGRATASGLVRFRGTEHIALLDIADGNHVLTVVGGGRTVAVGSIPALQPLG